MARALPILVAVVWNDLLNHLTTPTIAVGLSRFEIAVKGRKAMRSSADLANPAAFAAIFYAKKPPQSAVAQMPNEFRVFPKSHFDHP